MNPIKIHKKMEDWEWWTDSFCVHIMIFLLVQAKQKATTFKGNPVRRGQVVAGKGKISKGTGIPEQVVKTRMKNMIASGDFSVDTIKSEGGKPYWIITITNYEEYQKDEAPARKATPYMQNQKQLMQKDMTEDFLEWFEVYKKGSKRNAWLRWQQTEKGRPPLNELIEITRQYIEYCSSIERTRMDGEGWLNQRFFENEWTHEAQGTEPAEGYGENLTYG